MPNNKLIEIKLKQLQQKTHRYVPENIKKLQSHNNLINEMKKKYPMFFSIIETSESGMQYKKFLSGFFKCKLKNSNEPFLIKVKKGKTHIKDKNYQLYVYNKYTANNNYLSLVSWDKYNIIQCDTKSKIELKDTHDFITFGETPKEEVRLNKEQFMQSLIVLFPKFIKRFPHELLTLNNKLDESPKSTISIRHLYNYLVYCGDKLSKSEYEKYKFSFKKDRYTNINKLSKAKIYTFLKVFTYKQLINILVN